MGDRVTCSERRTVRGGRVVDFDPHNVTHACTRPMGHRGGHVFGPVPAIVHDELVGRAAFEAHFVATMGRGPSFDVWARLPMAERCAWIASARAAIKAIGNKTPAEETGR